MSTLKLLSVNNLSKYHRLSVGLAALLRGVDANDHCSWCHYLSCVPTSKWSCHTEAAYCLVSILPPQNLLITYLPLTYVLKPPHLNNLAA
jgi:hypothetical protein